jgi:hypothetical protein
LSSCTIGGFSRRAYLRDDDDDDDDDDTQQDAYNKDHWKSEFIVRSKNTNE